MKILSLFKWERLLWIQLVIFVVGIALVILTILFLGGPALLKFITVPLIEAFGLGLAVMAMVYFFLRIGWQLHTPSLSLSILVFFVGMSIFLSVSISRLYAMQYPVYVQTFGTGVAPGLPLSSMLSFFKHVNQFAYIDDIARDPNDVPPPLSKIETISSSLSLENLNTQTHEMSSENLLQGSEDSVLLPNEEATIILEGLEEGILESVTVEEVPEIGATVRHFNLTTIEVLAEIAPGIIQNYWTFDKTVPGPMLRARVGDIIEITLTNDSTSLHSHNVDLHAVSGPGGGGEVSVVAPGESKTFRFKALNPGLFIYHCAVPNMAVHMAHGMYGMILIEPKEGLPEVDHEFYIMQGELYTTGAIGRKGLQAFDAKKMLNSNPTYITFNGRPEGTVGKMTAKVGDTIRMYVGNGGVAHNSSFHVVGEIFDTVYPEASIGGALLKNVQTTNVPAGGATIVEFKVDYPGTYVLVDHALMRTDKGAWGTIEVTGEANSEIYDGDFNLSEATATYHH